MIRESGNFSRNVFQVQNPTPLNGRVLTKDSFKNAIPVTPENLLKVPLGWIWNFPTSSGYNSFVRRILFFVLFQLKSTLKETKKAKKTNLLRCAIHFVFSHFRQSCETEMKETVYDLTECPISSINSLSHFLTFCGGERNKLETESITLSSLLLIQKLRVLASL
jgi:hypothetical protein